jgi:uncharacterized protein
MDTFQDKELKNAITDFKKELTKKYSLDKTLLLGSRARGDYLNTSDIDLLMIAKDFKDIPFRARMADVLGHWRHPHDLEALCYAPEEHKRLMQRHVIVRKATEEGIEI